MALPTPTASPVVSRMTEEQAERLITAVNRSAQAGEAFNGIADRAADALDLLAVPLPGSGTIGEAVWLILGAFVLWLIYLFLRHVVLAFFWWVFRKASA